MLKNKIQLKFNEQVRQHGYSMPITLPKYEMNENYLKHLAQLQRYWSEPSSFAKVEVYMNSIKQCNLTSIEIGMLRDSISAEGTTSDAMQKRQVLRGLLEDAYNKMIERHSIAIVLFWLISIVFGGLIGFYLKQMLERLK